MTKTSTACPVKSYWLDRFGIDNLAIKETEHLQLKPGQVRVKMHAVSLNYRDLLLIKGLYDPKALDSSGLIPLSDGAGEVIETAADVSDYRVGDHVAGIFLQDWLAGQCNHEMTKSALGGAIDGVLTTEKIFNQEGLVHLPVGYSFTQGSTLPCAAITAWHALVYASKIKAGDFVLLQGTGGVSIFALQFAKMHGAKAIIISSSDEKLEKAKALGADFLINYKKDPDWQARARAITGGKGVDHIVEVGGAQTLAQSLRAIKMNGTVLVIGVLSGIESSLNLLPVLMKNLSIQGIYVGSREMFESMNRAITANHLCPVIDRIFTFPQAKEALQYLESGKHFGKVVIKIE